MTPNERRTLARNLRDIEKKTFREIGERLGCGSQRAREIYLMSLRTHEPPYQWTDPLSSKEGDTLRNAGFRSKDEVAKALASGKLKPFRKWPRGYGWKTHVRVHEWLGLPPPTKGRLCPHCGKPV